MYKVLLFVLLFFKENYNNIEWFSSEKKINIISTSKHKLHLTFI